MATLKDLNEQNQKEAEVVKSLELDRLDALWSTYFSRAMNGDYAAFDRCMTIMDKRARYQSIPEAPQSLDVTTGGRPLDGAFEAALLKVYGGFHRREGQQDGDETDGDDDGKSL